MNKKQECYETVEIPEDKNVFFMTIQKFLILIYTKNRLKPAPDKGKKKSRLLTLCQHRFLFLQPI